MMTVQQAFTLGLQHYQAGRLAEAEAVCRQILAVQPRHAGALHLLGILAHQAGRHDLAIEWIRQALLLEPNNGAAWSNLGEACRVSNRHDEALAAYHRAVQLDPTLAEVHYNLGVILATRGQLGEAATAYRRALALKPDFAEAHNNLGSALQHQGQFEAAITAHRRALEFRPNYADAHNNLGLALARGHQLEEAIVAYRRALQLDPHLAPAHYNLGNAFRERKQFDKAIAAYRQALELQPNLVEAHNNLGAIFKEQGRLEEAIAAYRRALELQPAFADAHNNLGNAFTDRGQLTEAIAAFGRAVELQPDFAEAHNNAGIALKRRGQLDEAIAAYRRALELQPAFAEACNNLGTALRQRGDLDAALAALRQSLAWAPERAMTHSNLIFALHFDPRADVKTIAEEQRRWNRQFGETVRRFIQPHRNDRHPDRRLKIGYVSPDFYDHVAGRNIVPLFRGHDHRDFEIVCYSAVVQADELTAHFRQRADHWRQTLGVTDEALAEMIRQDGVDILVDLAQHSAGNRLPVFARQPAPVQTSFAGYPESTGVEAIEYRVSDRWLDSEIGDGRSEIGWKSEPELRSPNSDLRAERTFLIDSFWCYDPCGMEVKTNALPAGETGHVTFGSLNNFSKVNEPLLQLWARVLRKVSDSHVVILAGAGSHRQRTVEFLEQEGVASTRVEFLAPCPRQAYLESYHRLDIVLDTFPYNGHTTSLDALWMGVPVVSLAGETRVSRGGLSVLNNLGLPELVAHSEEEYVEIATRLARNLPRLAELRRTLRARLETSVLMDGPRFTRNIEAAYRAMWQHWCAATPS